MAFSRQADKWSTPSRQDNTRSASRKLSLCVPAQLQHLSGELLTVRNNVRLTAEHSLIRVLLQDGNVSSLTTVQYQLICDQRKLTQQLKQRVRELQRQRLDSQQAVALSAAQEEVQQAHQEIVDSQEQLGHLKQHSITGVCSVNTGLLWCLSGSATKST